MHTRYLGALARALCLLNLLPVWRLDGRVLLRAVLDMCAGADVDGSAEWELEAAEGGVAPARAGRRRGRWRERVLDGTAVGVLALGGVCTLLSVTTGFVRGWG